MDKIRGIVFHSYADGVNIIFTGQPDKKKYSFNMIIYGYFGELPKL